MEMKAEMNLFSETLLDTAEIQGLAETLALPASPTMPALNPAISEEYIPVSQEQSFKDEIIALGQKQIEQIVDQQKIADYRNHELDFKVSSQMEQTKTLFQHLINKFYYCNFLYKYTPKGFQKYWVEQWGVVLFLWPIPSELCSLSYTAELSMEEFVRNEIDPPTEVLAAIKQTEPAFINILDSIVELSLSFDGNFIPPPFPYTNYFALGKITTCPLFACGSTIQLNHWVSSIRLAMYEVYKLNTIYTVRWLESPLRTKAWADLKLEPFKTASFRGDIRHEGPLQIRIPYSNVWRQYHVVVTSKTGSLALNQNFQSKIFGRGKYDITDYSKRGTLLIYNNSSSAQKGKAPLITITDCLWINAIFPMDNNSDSQINSTTLAKLYGGMHVSSRSSNSGKPDVVSRSLFPLAEQWQDINNLEELSEIFQGNDQRPLPKEFLIMAPTHYELAKWIASISASFGLPCDNELSDKELAEMTKIEDQEIITESFVPVIWPTQLYLSIEEVGGISMLTNDLAETFNQFSHFLAQKIQFSGQNIMQDWCSATAKGDWERKFQDRKEVEFKFLKLLDWKHSCVKLLEENGIKVSKANNAVLISALCNLAPWLSEVFYKLVPIASSPVAATSPKGIKEVIRQLPQSAVASDSIGSVSEEERSSEGSVSEEENSPSPKPSPVVHIINKIPPVDPGDDCSGSSEESVSSDESAQEVYAPDTLLAQVQENQRYSKLQKQISGPFITSAEIGNRSPVQLNLEPRGQQQHFPDDGSSFSEPQGGLVNLIGQISSRKPQIGPLVGNVNELNKKPVFEAGLVGQMQRKEDEKYLSKAGLKSTAYDTLIRRSEMVYRFLLLIRPQQTPEIVLSLISLLKSQLSQLSRLINQQTLFGSSPQVLQQQVSIMQDTLTNLSLKAQETRPTSSIGSDPLNPYAVPNLQWNTNSDSSGPRSNSMFSPQKSISSESSESNSSSGTESSEDSSDSSSASQSQSIPLGRYDYPTASSDASSSLLGSEGSEENENVPLARQSLIQPASFAHRPDYRNSPVSYLNPEAPTVPLPLSSVSPVSVPFLLPESNDAPANSIPAVAADSVLVDDSDQGSQSEDS